MDEAGARAGGTLGAAGGPTGSGLTVVRLGVRHADRLAAIERLVFLEPMAPSEFADALGRPNALCLGVMDGEEIAAYFGFQVFGPTAHVMANATHPAYRRQGLAHFLLTTAEPLAAALGARWFLGEVRWENHDQLRVLSRAGWADVARVPQFFGNGEDAHLVVKVFDRSPVE
jgi:ribosomal-protein-alanine N-acetyltransferase